MHLIANKTEEAIVDHLIDRLLAEGYTLGVNDGYLTTLHHCTDKEVLKEHMATTDEDFLLVFNTPEDKYVDWIHLAWGNEDAVIANNTLNKIGPLMEDVSDFVDGYVSGYEYGVKA